MKNTNDFFKHLFSITSNERGKTFEAYCKWFLENDPIYASQLKKVWLWKDWPGNWGRDKGIDLIAETHRGEFWAIQAKCYDKSYYVTKEDVDKFLSESSRASISYRLLICTTDLLGDNAREVIAGQEKQVGICSLENLLASSLEWPISLESLQTRPPRQPKTPKPHQEKAISDILEGFKNHDRGQLYMACGTGKTLVGLWLSEQLKCQNILVLVPSISLVSQLYQEWVANATTKFIPIFVCSDPTVSDNDQIVTNLYELGFPTTTDPKEILDYFSSEKTVPRVIFSTYHSSPVIAEVCNLDKSLIFDLTVADEAHRCAGTAKSDFATLFKPEAIRTRRKLFMTATPKIFSDHVKTKAKELEYEIISMDDHQKFGPVLHKLPFSAAIAQDLLCDYEVLISIMDDSTFREYAEKGRFVAIHNHESDARTIASQLLISKAIKSHDLRRVITFHNRKSAAQDFISTFPIALNLISEPQRPVVGFYGMILGDMLQSKRKSILKLFESVETGQSGVLANVRCLSEGVDVPTLDGVAFIDPKGSEIDIVQAVGRAIRKAPNKKKGLILLPVFIDANEDPEINLEESCFKPIWKVLNALRAHDDILAEELDNLRLELGKRTYKKPPKLSKITIDLPVSIDSAFSESLRLKIIENTSVSWFYYFGLLQNFKELNGHCNVPSNYSENPQLATWVGKQRDKFEMYKRSNEFRDRIIKLDELGFDWDPFLNAWEKMYSELSEFKAHNGHCNVSKETNKQLGSWVVVQRTKFNTGKLSEERVNKLKRIDFIWNAVEAKWTEMFSALILFKERHGHCNVPQGYMENPPLANWVGIQRNTYKENKISQERISKLESIDFDWNPINSSWEKMFSNLCRFKEENSHCNVPASYPENMALSSWITHLRVLFKNRKLEEERITRLEAIGFDWDPINSAWNDLYANLCDFKTKNGHCNVPQIYPPNVQLGSWVATQRSKFNAKKLPTERQKKLEAIGFIWDPNNSSWEDMFTQLCEFKEVSGHCMAPKEYPENPKLGAWVAKQSRLFNTNQLPPIRVQKLESIGFVWHRKNDRWQKNFNRLAEFKKRTGHFDILEENPNDLNFDSWIRTQGAFYRKGRLSQERINDLESIGFTWDYRKDAVWEGMLLALCQYKEINGDCMVPIDYPANPKLASWVSYQRQYYRAGKLPKDRIVKLEELGFTWEPFESFWQELFNELVLYKTTYGDCKVPAKYSENPRLGGWVARQRELHREGLLPQEQFKMLESLGFAWGNLKVIYWEKMFLELCKYKENHGNCCVPGYGRYPENPKLSSWVANQKQAYRKGKLSQEQIVKLESLGFVWNIEETAWEEMFNELVAFKKLNGHCNVKRERQNYESLGRWVVHQREKHQKSKLTNHQVEKLESIGFTWKSNNPPTPQ